MLYIREFNGRQLMSPICRLIDFCVRTFCSTGGWNCAAVSNDGLGFMRVVGREQSIVSRANSPAIVTFVRVFWAKYCEVRRGEERGHSGPDTGPRHNNQESAAASGEHRVAGPGNSDFFVFLDGEHPVLRPGLDSARENCFIHWDDVEFNVWWHWGQHSGHWE